MSAERSDLWQLLADSRLVPPDRLASLRAEYSQAGLPTDYPAVLARWLMVHGALTAFQAKTLLTGRSGPFFVGEFRLNDRYESGRMAGLFQATHLESQRRAWLWLFPRAAAEKVQQAVETAKRVAAAKHPALLRCYGTVRAGESRFAVLEYFDGTSLAVRLARRALPAPQACRIARQLAQAVASLHALGIAHGDLRPENVLVDSAGRIKLLHFPLARDPFSPAELDFRDLDAPRLRRAVNYAAPQLAQPGSQPDAAADIYAIGCLLFELLMGRPPFPGGNPLEKMRRHASEPIEGLAEVPRVERGLADTVALLMAKDAALRPASALETAQRLKPFAGLEEPLAPGAPPAIPEVQFDDAPAATPAAPSDSAPPIGEPAEADEGAILEPGPQSIGRPPIESILTGGGGLASLARVRKRRRQRQLVTVGVVLSIVLAATAASAWAWRQGWLVAGLTAADRNRSQREPIPTSSGTADGAAGVDAGAAAGAVRAAAGKGRVESPTVESSGASPIVSSIGSSAASSAPVDLVDDDGETLWASPTDGAPIDLDFLPPGAQLVLVLRPAEIWANPEAEKVLSALGPKLPPSIRWLEELVGLPLKDLELLKIAFYASSGEPVRLGVVADLKQPADWSAVSQRWRGAAPAERVHGAACWRGPEYSYFAPADADDRILVIGRAEEFAEMIAQPKPALRKEVERLLRDTDELRLFTMLFAPRDLLEGEGRRLLSGGLDRLRQPVEDFLAGADVKFAALSLHLNDQCFAELRLLSTIESNPQSLADSLQARLSDLPERVESYLASLNPHPHGKLLLVRLPRMVNWLQEYTRSGIENKQAVLRSYLPASAAHNLLMGVELALADRAGATPVVVQGPAERGPVSAAAALQTKISLSFSKDTLEKSLELLGREIDVEIVIMGGDLQLDGITKNQSFELNERDQPAGQILGTILKKANPDGKLVYVIKPRGGKEALFITTRSQAQRRGDPLPAGFR